MAPPATGRDVYGKPALFVATEAELVERLVIHGADTAAPLDPDAPWQTPEAMLIYWGWTELVVALRGR